MVHLHDFVGNFFEKFDKYFVHHDLVNSESKFGQDQVYLTRP